MLIVPCRITECLDIGGIAILGEVFLGVIEAGRHFQYVLDIAVNLLDGKSTLPERVDIAIYRSVGCAKLVCQFVNREVGIACHHSYQAQNSFNL